MFDRCAACDGEGRRAIRTTRIDPNTGRYEVKYEMDATCDVCEGSGMWVRVFQCPRCSKEQTIKHARHVGSRRGSKIYVCCECRELLN